MGAAKNNLPYLSLALFLMIYNICAKLFLFRMLLSYNLKGLMSYNLKGLMSHNLNSLSIVTPLPISRHISRTGANRHACARECQSVFIIYPTANDYKAVLKPFVITLVLSTNLADTCQLS